MKCRSVRSGWFHLLALAVCGWGAVAVSLWALELRAEASSARLDEALEDAVVNALRYEPRVERFAVGVTVNNRVATLSGQVDNLGAKRAAARTARTVPGIARVRNFIQVSPPLEIADEDLAWRILRALRESPRFDPNDVRVRVVRGTVYLTGRVRSERAAAAAEEIASGVRGVREVVDRLRVRPPRGSRLGDATILARLRSQIMADPFLESDEIRIAVENGTAFLSGTVDSQAERAAAVASAYEAGAVRVRNELRIYDDFTGPYYRRGPAD